jgi:hypothetical protein
MDPAHEVAVHANLAEALRRIVDRREDRVAGEGKDDCVRVKRAQPSERQILSEIGFRQEDLQGDNDADQHTDNPQISVAITKNRTIWSS